MNNNINFNGLTVMLIDIQRRIIRWRLTRLHKKNLGGLELLPHLIKLLNFKLVTNYSPGIANSISLTSRRTDLEVLLQHTKIIITSIENKVNIPKETQYDSYKKYNTNLEEFLTSTSSIEMDLEAAITLTKQSCDGLIKTMHQASTTDEERHSYRVRKTSNVVDDLLEVCVAFIKLQL